MRLVRLLAHPPPWELFEGAFARLNREPYVGAGRRGNKEENSSTFGSVFKGKKEENSSTQTHSMSRLSRSPPTDSMISLE